MSHGLVDEKGNMCLCSSMNDVNSELAGFGQQVSFQVRANVKPFMSIGSILSSPPPG